MSDPVTNVEIEDVLSSIRKLVSEDVRATPVARKPERPGKLILTPSQRVRDEAPAPARTQKPVLLTQPILPPDAGPTELAIDEIPRDARLADFGAVEGAFPDIDQIEVADESGDAVGQVAEDRTDAQDDWNHVPQHEDWVDASGPDGGHDATQDDPRSELNRLIEEEVFAALALSPDADGDKSGREEDCGWQDVETEDHWAPEDEALSFDDAVRAEEHGADAVSEQSEDHSDALETHAEPIAEPVSAILLTLEDKVAALGRLVARDSQDFEEERDRPDADELAAISERMTWPEAPYEEVDDAPASDASNVLHVQDAWPQPQSHHDSLPEPVEEQTDALQTQHSTDEAALEIDEDMLRQMVIDIVRQELQGALGERITRNVRKLVRREIHRMLISQDLD
jgi:hypothetical protein